MVLFHFRIDHRGSEARLPRPADYRKLGIFIPCSANNEHVANYRAWQELRVDYLWLKNGHDYPADLRALIASNGLRLG
ncbi:MAG: hypothetical protein FJX76_23945 [Armatimonadetes bacterium]|nr:hypothetical protein [Armatimonadota bacterium]